MIPFPTFLHFLSYLRSTCGVPLAVGPGAVVEVGSFPADDVQAPAGRQVLELILHAARLRLTAVLLLRNQACTDRHRADVRDSIPRDASLCFTFLNLVMLL